MPEFLCDLLEATHIEDADDAPEAPVLAALRPQMRYTIPSSHENLINHIFMHLDAPNPGSPMGFAIPRLREDNPRGAIYTAATLVAYSLGKTVHCFNRICMFDDLIDIADDILPTEPSVEIHWDAIEIATPAGEWYKVHDHNAMSIGRHDIEDLQNSVFIVDGLYMSEESREFLERIADLSNPEIRVFVLTQ